MTTPGRPFPTNGATGAEGPQGPAGAAGAAGPNLVTAGTTATSGFSAGELLQSDGARVQALSAGTAAGDIVQLDGSAKLPAVDGSQLRGVAAQSISTPIGSATFGYFPGTGFPQLQLSVNCGIGMSGNTAIYQEVDGYGESVWGVDAIGSGTDALPIAEAFLDVPGYFQVVATVAVVDFIIASDGAAQDNTGYPLRFTSAGTATVNQTVDMEWNQGTSGIITGITAEGYSFDIDVPYDYVNANSMFTAVQGMMAYDYVNNKPCWFDGSTWKTLADSAIVDAP